jgi:hypothetical protein
MPPRAAINNIPPISAIKVPINAKFTISLVPVGGSGEAEASGVDEAETIGEVERLGVGVGVGLGERDADGVAD